MQSIFSGPEPIHNPSQLPGKGAIAGVSARQLPVSIQHLYSKSARGHIDSICSFASVVSVSK